MNTNLGYLFAIYIITWAGFFAYVFLVSRRQRELERELKELRAMLEAKHKPTQGAGG
jgi:CcmD family protein